MSGLYNMVFGTDPSAPFVLAMLSIPPKTIPRLRDAYPHFGKKKFAIITRCGSKYHDEYREQVDALRAHPEYVEDYDDPFDDTYCTFIFEIPVEYRERFLAEMAKYPDRKTLEVGERFQEAIGEIREGKRGP